ncbi:glycosyltransferase [[Clostridium] hylemonae]|uniref:glycosyltransferase n=1 Tax=[Clostridium] hylemonae TaxID=89153 RepID=UPI001D07443D|nr:glycosyltransferase [[Clostridium] hylemonae]MCB7520189.1 glycosyltransferase [[Clostridium] hylemonae]
MKILHISRTMGHGGAEKVVYQLCRDNKKHEQKVASCGGEYEEVLKKQGIEHFYIPDIHKKNPVSVFKTIHIIAKLIKKENFDIIHTHHRMAAFYTRTICLFNSKISHVYTSHSIFYGKRMLLRYALKGAKIVAVGNSVKKNLIEEYGIDEDNISLVYNAINPQDVSNYKNKVLIQEKLKGSFLIGCIGRLSYEKGIDIFLKSISIVLDSANSDFTHIKAVIIGDGKERQRLELMSKELNIEKNIIFLGYQDKVLDIIRQLDLIVLSSRWEGLPLLPIEVFSQGKTLIASDIPGTNEVVFNNINGLLFKSEDAVDLSEKILLLVENGSLLRQYETAAAVSFNERFSYEKFLNSYNEVYDSI